VLLVEAIEPDVTVLEDTVVAPPIVGEVVGVPCVPTDVDVDEVGEDADVGPVGVGEVTLGSTAKGQ